MPYETLIPYSEVKEFEEAGLRVRGFKSAKLKEFYEKLIAMGIPVSASWAASLFSTGDLDRMFIQASNTKSYREYVCGSYATFKADENRLYGKIHGLTVYIGNTKQSADHYWIVYEDYLRKIRAYQGSQAQLEDLQRQEDQIRSRLDSIDIHITALRRHLDAPYHLEWVPPPTGGICDMDRDDLEDAVDDARYMYADCGRWARGYPGACDDLYDRWQHALYLYENYDQICSGGYRRVYYTSSETNDMRNQLSAYISQRRSLEDQLSSINNQQANIGTMGAELDYLRDQRDRYLQLYRSASANIPQAEQTIAELQPAYEQAIAAVANFGPKCEDAKAQWRHILRQFHVQLPGV